MIAKKSEIYSLSADTSQTDSFKQRQKKGQVIEDTLTLGKKNSDLLEASEVAESERAKEERGGDPLFRLAANYDDFAKIIL